MVARSFCELFVAGCIEVESREVHGERVRLYRAVDDVDMALLGRAERIVVRCLSTFRSFRALLELAQGELQADPPGQEQGTSLREEELLAEMGEVIDDALEYLPPACSCSV